jgi:hypothetical protein
MPRRDFLQVGLGGMLGLGLSDILRLNAATAKPQSVPQVAPAVGTKPVNCILIWLDGGPSHYETFDPKPDAPAEIRGDFKPIPTAVPGIRFSEAVPELAKVADRFTVVRSICHRDPNHGGGNHYMITGAPTPVPVACGLKADRAGVEEELRQLALLTAASGLKALVIDTQRSYLSQGSAQKLATWLGGQYLYLPGASGATIAAAAQSAA